MPAPPATLPPGPPAPVLASSPCQAFDRAQLGPRGLAFGRHDFYKVALVTGSSRYQYATRGVLVDRPALVFSNPLVPYAWEPLSEAQGGYLCLFTEEFLLPAGRSSGASLQQSPLFRPGSDPVYFVGEGEYATFRCLFEQLLREQASTYPHRQEVVRHYLHLVLHEALKLQPPPATYYPHAHAHAAARLAEAFQLLLDRQFPLEATSPGLQLRTPGDFARCLAVPVNQLNRAVRAHTGRATSAHIAARLVAEATALLHYTHWSTADIAYALGFAYPPHFNNFFKKHTGTTPSARRAALRA